MAGSTQGFMAGARRFPALSRDTWPDSDHQRTSKLEKRYKDYWTSPLSLIREDWTGKGEEGDSLEQDDNPLSIYLSPGDVEKVWDQHYMEFGVIYK